METVVVKFGGPALTTPEKIVQVAKKVIKEQGRGINLVVVVSSMPALRREFRQYAAEITDEPSKREMDALVASAAQMTSAILAMAIQEHGGKAVSLGWQTGIQTNQKHGNARIDHVDSKRIEEYLALGEIVVVVRFSRSYGDREYFNIRQRGF